MALVSPLAGALGFFSMTGKVTLNQPIILSATQNYDMGSVSIAIDGSRVRLSMYILDDSGKQVGQAATELEGERYDLFMANYPDLLKVAVKTILADKQIDADVDGAAKGADIAGTVAVQVTPPAVLKS